MQRVNLWSSVTIKTIENIPTEAEMKSSVCQVRWEESSDSSLFFSAAQTAELGKKIVIWVSNLVKWLCSNIGCRFQVLLTILPRIKNNQKIALPSTETEFIFLIKEKHLASD